MNSGASTTSTKLTKIRLASALPRNSADGGAGDIRCASSTRFLCSRVHDWFSAVNDANSSATHKSPPQSRQNGSRWIERQRKNYHHQQREETALPTTESRRAPLQPQVLLQMAPHAAEVAGCTIHSAFVAEWVGGFSTGRWIAGHSLHPPASEPAASRTIFVRSASVAPVARR